MNPLLEVRPAACLFVVGPQLTRDSAPHAANLSYEAVVQSGIDRLQECGSGAAKVPHLRKEGKWKAMRTAVALLRKKGLYENWMKKTFSTRSTGHEQTSIPDSVRLLLELQRLGAMLACTQYDTLLDSMAGLRPAVISEEHSLAEWLRRDESAQGGGGVTSESRAAATATEESEFGFLHLHGAQTALDSLRILPYSEAASSSDADCIPEETMTQLKSLFHSKLVFLVGFDDDHQDPLLPSFLQLVYPEGDAKVLKNPPILLTSRSAKCSSLLQCKPTKVLHLKIHSMDRLRDVILPGEAKNFSVGMFNLVYH